MRRNVVVIGLGNFGSTVALELARQGHAVLGVDADERRVDDLVDRLSHALVADARDERALEELGLEGYDVALLGIGEDLEASILATLFLKGLGIRVWAKAKSRNHHRILERLGADRVIHPEQDSALHVAQRLLHPDLVDFMAFGDARHVVEVRAPEALEGKRIEEVELGEGVVLLARLRGEELTLTGAALEAEVIRTGDRFLLTGPVGELAALAERL